MEISYIDIEFESSLLKLKEILYTVPIVLKNSLPYISEDDLIELRLLFTELLSNAIIHGNKENPSKRVRLAISVNDNFISAKIRDEGEGFDYLKALDCNSFSTDYLNNEHGRGLTLASNLADQLNFNEIGNEVQFSKLLNYEEKEVC